MHAAPVTHVLVTPGTAFVVTGSRDGRLKFWKKRPEGIEFVKQFRAHTCPLASLAVSPDGLYLASCGVDGSCNLFDVINFDMIQMFKLPSPAVCAAWLPRQGQPLLLVCGDSQGRAHIVDRSKSPETAISTLVVHQSYMTTLTYVSGLECLLSTDAKGLIELWVPNGNLWAPPKGLSFTSKSSTDLYMLCKAKTFARSVAVSPDGSKAAFLCMDDKLRILILASGRLQCTYDESSGAQKSPGKCEASDAARRAVVHEQVRSECAAAVQNGLPQRNGSGSLCWDESSQLLLIPSMWGIKVLSTVDHRLLRIIGGAESDRYASLALFQGRVSANLDLGDAVTENTLPDDPTLFATSFSNSSVRFFLFSRRLPIVSEEENTGGRDVLNERPTDDVGSSASAPVIAAIPEVCVLHTSLGDIRLRLFPKLTPQTYDNFSGLVNKGYYDGLEFHRVIRGFMIQTGDPSGDGSGGESLWYPKTLIHQFILIRLTKVLSLDSGEENFKMSFGRICFTIGRGR